MWKESLVKVRKSDQLLGRSKHQRVGKQVAGEFFYAIINVNYLHEANQIPVQSWSAERRDTSCVSTTAYGKSDISKIKKLD